MRNESVECTMMRVCILVRARAFPMTASAHAHPSTEVTSLSADRPATRLATRLAFLVAGFGIACWAPLVPFAKQRLAVDDGVLGILLLCLGVGSVAAMLLTGVLSARYGSKPIIVAGALGLSAILPLLAITDTPWALGLALLVFGAALGSLDVAMNVHAVEVERAASRPLMSGFHALFSVGGFAGSTLMTFLLSMRWGPFASTLLCSALMVIATALAWPRLIRTTRTAEGPHFVLPHGIVLALAALAAVTFLVEGAILDWSALLLTDTGLVDAAQGGLGYVLFSIAMTAGRFGGDAVAARLGDRTVLSWGGLLALGGFVVQLTAPSAALAMTGFLLIGLGASNLVPVLFRRAGAQRAMPPALAVAAITTTGYAGILVGPAAVGFVAQGVGLQMAFWMLAALLCLVPLCARVVTTDRN
jgi:predicted MFS family arabinose efflux permease